MQAFRGCWRSAAPDIDGAVNKLVKSAVSLWVLLHADVWLAAVPSLNFDSDQSDVETAEEGEEEEEQAPPLRKRKAGANNDVPEQKAKKKAKKRGNVEWICRVVAVPACKFGKVFSTYVRQLNFMEIG